MVWRSLVVHPFAVFNERHDKRSINQTKQQKTYVCKDDMRVHDTNTIFIFFIEMQMAKVRKLKILQYIEGFQPLVKFSSLKEDTLNCYYQVIIVRGLFA